jgi:hypothetical protein
VSREWSETKGAHEFVDASRAIVYFGTTHRYRKQRSLTRQGAVTIPVSVASILVAIGKLVRKDSVDPALKDGWESEPPNRKLKNHAVGP